MSTNLLSTAELAQMRTDIEAVTLPDTCQILTVEHVADGEGGMTDVWSGDELAVNGTFEVAGAGGPYYALSGWTGNIKTGGTVSQGTATGEYYAGTAGLRLDSGTSEGHHTRAEQLWTLKMGKTYAMSVYARGDGTADGKWAMFDYASEWLWPTDGNVHTGNAGTAFAQVTASFTVGTVDARCFVALGATSVNNGFACWDNFSLVEVPPAIPCRIDAQGGGESDVARSAEPYATFVLTLPQATEITTEDRVLHNGYTYAVTAVDDDSSWMACKRATLEWVE